MTEKELIRRGMKAKGVTQEELAKMYGYTVQSTIGTILKPGTSMRVDVMVRMLDLLGYEVKIFDKETGEKLGRITSKITAPTKHKKKPVEEPVTKVKESKPIPVFQYGK